jgi:hypothetical protein
MTPLMECPRERDVLDLVAIGRWPDRADHELVAHVARCASCADLAAVAVAVADLRDEEARPRVPDAALVWHRAQIRARADAARLAARPLLLAQAAGLAALVVLLTIWWAGLSGWLGETMHTAGSLVATAAQVPAAVQGMIDRVRQTASADAAAWRWLAGAIAGVVVVSIALGLSRLVDGPEESR